MATIKIASAKSGTGKLENYLKQEEKTDEKLMYGKDCDSQNFTQDFEMIRNIYDKTDGRQHYHIIQSFDKGEISPELAHEVGREFAENEYFKGYQMVVITHYDKEHIHNHVVMNSVNAETGEKYQSNAKDLYLLRDISDRLCKERDLSIVREKSYDEQIRSYDRNEYKMYEGDKFESSWKVKAYKAIEDVKEYAKNKDEFVKGMNERGYEVAWEDNRKYITFEDKEGHKVRDKNLEKTFSTECSKESFSKVFEKNRDMERVEMEKERKMQERKEQEIKKQREQQAQQEKQKEQESRKEYFEEVKDKFENFRELDHEGHFNDTADREELIEMFDRFEEISQNIEYTENISDKDIKAIEKLESQIDFNTYKADEWQKQIEEAYKLSLERERDRDRDYERGR